jgi:SsrA-binding protein
MKGKKEVVSIKNRKASFDYIFLEDYTAGIQLTGTEVKSIRAGKISLVDAFCFFQGNELFLKEAIITSTEDAFSHDPKRDRKLLLKRKELERLKKKSEKGTTIVVKRIFTNERGFLKAEISLAKGKKNFDKRESLKEKDVMRDLQQQKRYD